MAPRIGVNILVLNCGVKVAGDESLDMLGGPEWGQREATPPRDAPLPSFGFTQEQVACVCEVSRTVCGKLYYLVTKLNEQSIVIEACQYSTLMS